MYLFSGVQNFAPQKIDTYGSCSGLSGSTGSTGSTGSVDFSTIYLTLRTSISPLAAPTWKRSTLEKSVVPNAAATCEADGEKVYTCSCGEKYTETIPATGHSESAWIIDKAATATENGSKHTECTTCGKVIKTEVIPAPAYQGQQDLPDQPALLTSRQYT